MYNYFVVQFVRGRFTNQLEPVYAKIISTPSENYETGQKGWILSSNKEKLSGHRENDFQKFDSWSSNRLCFCCFDTVKLHVFNILCWFCFVFSSFVSNTLKLKTRWSIFSRGRSEWVWLQACSQTNGFQIGKSPAAWLHS